MSERETLPPEQSLDSRVVEQLKNNPNITYVGSHFLQRGAPLGFVLPGAGNTWGILKSYEARFKRNHIVALRTPNYSIGTLNASLLGGDGFDGLVEIEPNAVAPFESVTYKQSATFAKDYLCSVGRLFFYEEVGKEVSRNTFELNNSGNEAKLEVPEEELTEKPLTLITIVSLYPDSLLANAILTAGLKVNSDPRRDLEAESRKLGRTILNLQSYVPQPRVLTEVLRSLRVTD